MPKNRELKATNIAGEQLVNERLTAAGVILRPAWCG